MRVGGIVENNKSLFLRKRDRAAFNSTVHRFAAEDHGGGEALLVISAFTRKNASLVYVAE